MSQDLSSTTHLPPNPASPKDNSNPSNPTGLPNRNTNFISHNDNCFNTYNTTVTNDRSEILTWLSPLEPNLRHYDVQTRRADSVGEWLLQTEQFRSWRSGGCQGESQKAVIFCSGNPGVGKTYISSLVIDALGDGTGETGGKDVAVACFYFDFAAQQDQSAVSVLSALLKQVVGGLEQIPKAIVGLFQKQKTVIGGRRLRLPEILLMLGSLLSSRRTFLCLDALDECAAVDRTKILSSFRDIIRMSPTTRVFMTGRPHVGDEVEKFHPGAVAFVSISPQKGDIIRYIQRRLAEDSTPNEMDERLEAEIEREIPETLSEVFLLVSLNLDAILQETTIHRRRKRLRAAKDASHLEDSYGATLERIKKQGGRKSRLGMAALMWICHSERPLRVEELCLALAVEIGSTDYNAEDISSISTVLSCCQGLITVDKEGSALRLVHLTLQEHLTNHPNLFQSAHAVIAETCLTYLNSEQVIALSASGSPGPQHPPFLEYSAIYWGAHMKKEFTHRGKALALKFLSHYEGHISVKLLLEHLLGSSISVVDSRKFTALHCACLFGLVEVARTLIETDGVDINRMDHTGATPLTWAARRGEVGVVSLLLAREDINPNILDASGQTPILWAAQNKHGRVVELLLGHEGLNSNKQSNNCQPDLEYFPPSIPPTDDIGPEITIAVMGAAGAGKSYFIREVSGISDIVVGSGLRSYTASVQSYSFSYEGVKITLVDTPGFGDATKSDTEVLADICAWTSSSYREGRLLSGIIYLHHITHTHLEGSSLRNLWMFQRLCGLHALRNVFLTTTQWSNVDPAPGEKRERDLRYRDFWGGLISKGATAQRFRGTRESGMELIHKLMSNQPIPLDIQEQIVEQGMEMAETNAGKFVDEKLLSLQENYQKYLEDPRGKLQKAENERGDIVEEALAQEQAKALEKRKKAPGERELLADPHAEAMKKLEEAERKRGKERERSEKAVIAVATRDIWVTAHLRSMFTPYNTKGRLIYDINDPREFTKDPINIAIHYQSKSLPGIEVCMKTIAEIFDTGMSINNYISLDGAFYRCKGYDSIKRGSQRFVIFKEVSPGGL